MYLYLLYKVKINIIKYKYMYIIILCLIFIYIFSLPRTLFSNDYSTIIFDKNGELIGARIANDGQWRFPEDSVVPEKFKHCIVLFEDRHFYKHPGFNPGSLAKALIINIKAGKILTGGSTITMQVVRLYRNGRKRTVLEKLREIVLASRVELKYSKAEILKLYASHAPFGGNVVGLQAAAWRYFGRSAQHLSWAEAALLAVLPNSPSMIHPGKNREVLLKKRNRLLQKLYMNNLISFEDYNLSIIEPLPDKPVPLPDIAPHFTENLKKQFPSKQIKTSIQGTLQKNVNRVLLSYHKELLNNYIHNASVLILEVNTGNVLAYAGNIPVNGKALEGREVDCIQACRSTGSILKPLLFMAMQDEGLLLPGTLVSDIPTRIAGFKPENYNLAYDGAVPAKRALARSLNIPAVRMLQNYGIPKFQNYLQKLGMTTLVYPPDHYGLTLIVGGAEGKLWDITHMYAKLARKINQFPRYDQKSENISVSAGSAYLTFESLLEVNRPEEEVGWSDLSSSRKVAWKTGTSYGFRDAWAVGTTPEYIVGVWVGNADGEGRPGLTGIGVAAPLMFRIFNLLPSTKWFTPPYDDMEIQSVCRLSGYKAGFYCEETDSIYIARAGVKTSLCPFHVLVHLSPDSKYRVNSKCMSVNKMVHKTWFVLPPAMEWFYRKTNAQYRQLPPFMSGCDDDARFSSMELIYPTDVLKIFVPREIDGTPGKTIFEMAHRNPNAILYWHIDNEFIGSTKSIHQIALNPAPGKHSLTVIDNIGNTISRTFEVVDAR